MTIASFIKVNNSEYIALFESNGHAAGIHSSPGMWHYKMLKLKSKVKMFFSFSLHKGQDCIDIR